MTQSMGAIGASAAQTAGSGFNYGNLLNVAGTLASGFSQYRTAQENAEIQDNNLAISQQATADKLRDRRRRIGKDHAKQRVQFLASGVELEGSPLLVLEETLSLGEEDLNAIRISGGVQAENAKIKARSARSKGNAALYGSLFKAGNTLLTKKQTAVKIS